MIIRLKFLGLHNFITERVLGMSPTSLHSMEHMHIQSVFDQEHPTYRVY